MPSQTVAWTLRIRNAADSADALVIGTGGATPYIIDPIDGDGQEVNPATGETVIGVRTVRVVDADLSATPIVTSQLADANERQQLINRKAILEETLDSAATPITTTGFINALRLVDALTWDIVIGDTRRTERTRTIFERVTTRFDQVEQIIGPGIVGGWGPLPERAAIIAEVTAVDTNFVALQFLNLPEGSGYIRTTPADIHDHRVNARFRTDWVPDDTLISDDIYGRFPGVVAVVENLDTGATVDSFEPLSTALTNVDGGFTVGIRRDSLVGGQQTMYVPWTTSQPSVGDRYRIRVYRETIDEHNPLYLKAHPVDVRTDLWDDEGIAYDSAAAASVKTTLGSQTRVLYLITESSVLEQWAIAHIDAPLGIAVRHNSSGERELFSSRIRSGTVPATEITPANLVDETVWFDVDEATAINTVVVKTLGFVRESDGTVATFDRVRTYRLDSDGDGNPDSDDYGVREHTVELPGTVHILDGGPVTGGDLTDGTDELEYGIAHALFDRFGRGGIYTTLHAQRELQDDIALGDEVVLDLPFLPTNNVRGNRRIVQVVRRTVHPDHLELYCLDSGTETQIATNPSFSLAASSSDPKHVVDVTISNASTLNASNIKAEVEWLVPWPGGSPTGGTLLAILGQTEPVPGSFQLPMVNGGANIGVRMRGVNANRRHNSFTAWQTITLTGLSAPTSVAATPDAVDDGKYILTWTNNETSLPVEVLIKTTAGGATYRRYPPLLPPGSDRTVLYLDPTGGSAATPDWDYTVGVRVRDFAPLNGVSATAEDTINHTGTLITLAAPVSPAIRLLADKDLPRAIVPLDPGNLTLELSVLAGALPSRTVFELAMETSVGSGTPGSFAEVAVVPSVAERRTRVLLEVATDGLRRYLRAKHARDGATDSAYTSTVNVLPEFDAPKQPGPDLVDFNATGKRMRAALFDDGSPDLLQARIANIGARHRETTHPLSATDAGADATIDVASHDVQYPFGTVSYNSGSLTALSFETTYHVYADDAEHDGGAVSYLALEDGVDNTGDLVASPARYYVGTITTPANGGGDTGGEGGGGGPKDLDPA